MAMTPDVNRVEGRRVRAEYKLLKEFGFFYRCSQNNGRLPAGWVCAKHRAWENGSTRFTRRKALQFIRNNPELK